MIALSVLTLLATMAIPWYQGSVRDARVVKAKEELRIISQAIDAFRAKTGNLFFPVSLAQVGHVNRVDPWGNPYLYLNFQSGTGSGLAFALENKLVDSHALPLTKAMRDIAVEVQATRAPPVDLLTAAARTEIDKIVRKDKFLFALNNDYDLFSLGRDGQSLPSIWAAVSRDDVVRAKDGGYFGLPTGF